MTYRSACRPSRKRQCVIFRKSHAFGHAVTLFVTLENLTLLVTLHREQFYATCFGYMLATCTLHPGNGNVRFLYDYKIVHESYNNCTKIIPKFLVRKSYSVLYRVRTTIVLKTRVVFLYKYGTMGCTRIVHVLYKNCT